MPAAERVAMAEGMPSYELITSHHDVVLVYLFEQCKLKHRATQYSTP